MRACEITSLRVAGVGGLRVNERMRLVLLGALVCALVAPSCAPAGPGQGSDAAGGFVRLFDAEGHLLHERFVAFSRDVEPVWGTFSCSRISNGCRSRRRIASSFRESSRVEHDERSRSHARAGLRHTNGHEP